VIDNKDAHQKASHYLHWAREVARFSQVVAKAQDDLRNAQINLEETARELRQRQRGSELHVLCEGSLVIVRTSGEVVVTNGVIYNDRELTIRKLSPT
jgi:hypothetical protein